MERHCFRQMRLFACDNDGCYGCRDRLAKTPPPPPFAPLWNLRGKPSQARFQSIGGHVCVVPGSACGGRHRGEDQVEHRLHKRLVLEALLHPGSLGRARISTATAAQRCRAVSGEDDSNNNGAGMSKDEDGWEARGNTRRVAGEESPRGMNPIKNELATLTRKQRKRRRRPENSSAVLAPGPAAANDKEVGKSDSWRPTKWP